MAEAPLRVSEAGRQLGIPTQQVLVLLRANERRCAMLDGIAHVPVDALKDFQAEAS